MGLLPALCFLLSSLVGAVAYSFVVRFLYVHSEIHTLTTAQYGVAIAYGLAIVLWLGAEVGFLVARTQPRYDSIAEDEQDLVVDAEKVGLQEGAEAECKSPAAIPPDTVILGVRHSHMRALRACAEFAGIMGLLYLCDRTTLVGKGPKYVDPWAFWGVNGAILVGALLTIRGSAATAPAAPLHGEHVKPLQRDQTEEVRGRPLERASVPAPKRASVPRKNSKNLRDEKKTRRV